MIQEMYAEIQKQTDKHSVSELCEIYGVSRSGYYKWLKRAGQLNRYEKTHQILDRYVLDIHSHHPMMGYRQIRDKLRLDRQRSFCLEVNEASGDPRIHQAQESCGHRNQLRTHPLFQCAEQKFQSRAAYAEDRNGCYLHQT